MCFRELAYDRESEAPDVQSCIRNAVADSLHTYVEQNPSMSRGFPGVYMEEEQRFRYHSPEEGEVSTSEDSRYL